VSKQREHRKAKKREKVKKRRTAAQQKRGSRRVLGMAADRIEQARRWPMASCWASDNWHEQGAHVHVAFTRRHDDGRMAAAFFELDLADKGVVHVLADAPMTQAEIHGELAKRGHDGRALFEIDPMLAVKLVNTARDWGVKQGHDQHSGLQRAQRLFGGVRGSKAREEVRTGYPDPNAPKAPPASDGMLSGLKKRLFG